MGHDIEDDGAKDTPAEECSVASCPGYQNAGSEKGGVWGSEHLLTAFCTSNWDLDVVTSSLGFMVDLWTHQTPEMAPPDVSRWPMLPTKISDCRHYLAILGISRRRYRPAAAQNPFSERVSHHGVRIAWYYCMALWKRSSRFLGLGLDVEIAVFVE